MWTIIPLYAASCEQGASPSLSQGCRNSTPLSIAQVNCLSVDIVTIYMLRNANSAVLFSLILSNSPHFLESCIIGLYSATDSFPSRVPWPFNNIVCSFHTRHFCALYPVAVPHRVGTHPGHAYSRRVPAATGFTTHNMAGSSNMTRSTLGVMSSGFSDASSRHRTMSDLVPSFSFPLADTDGGHG